MKNFLLLLALLLASPAWSQSKLVFVLGPDVCPPVKVICGGSTYTVYNRLEIDPPSSTIYVTAYDCAGKKLTYDYGSKSGSHGGKHYSISTYTFRNVQDFSQQPTMPDGNNPGNSNVARPSSPSGGLATNTANAFATGITSLGGSDRPSLQARLGVSRGLGTFATLRFAGKRLQLYGSIGKDVFDSKYGNEISWNAGFGSYFEFGGPYKNPNMDIGLGLSVGHLATYENLCFMIDADYSWWVDKKRRIGLFGGVQIGWPDFINLLDKKEVETKFGWNISAGLAIRLAKF